MYPKNTEVLTNDACANDKGWSLRVGVVSVWGSRVRAGVVRACMGALSPMYVFGKNASSPISVCVTQKRHAGSACLVDKMPLSDEKEVGPNK